MKHALLLASALVVALSPIARADDPPGLALAKKVVDEVRGSAHWAKMRIVWPEKVEETPTEGAEVTLITGYIDNTLTRLVWHGGKVEARSVSTDRSWFYNARGESFGAAELDVDAANFATAWSAARFVIAAHDERLEPEPMEHEHSAGGLGAGSHESEKWIRLRVADASAPFYVGDARGGPHWNWEDVYRWEGIRADAVFRLLAPLVGDRSRGRPVAVVTRAAWVTEEIRRAAPRLDLAYHGEHHLLLEVCLRVGGEVGDSATRDAVDALETALKADERDDWDAKAVRETLFDEIETARAKLGLRLGWDAAVARRLLAAEPAKTNREWDLRIWIRHRYRENDPVGYLTFLGEERGRGVEPERGDVARTIDQLRTASAVGSADAVRAFLAHSDPDVRVAAARAILSIAPDDRDAKALIIAAARDEAIRPFFSEHAIHWVRVDALTEAAPRRLIGSDDLRALLAAEGSQHGLLVQALLQALAASSAPPTAEETLAAWRRAVTRPAIAGIEIAVVKLLDLKDIASRDAIEAAIKRLQEPATYSWGRGERQIDIVSLKKRLAAEMPAPK